jgi:hypothetical protein
VSPPRRWVEALNNDGETLVRRGRGYRNHAYMLRKLRFMVANPIRSVDGTRRSRVEVFHRPDRGHWRFEVAKAGESLTLHDHVISVDAVYA